MNCLIRLYKYDMCIDCVRTTSTIMDPLPKCELHKGDQIGFVLCQFTDGANKKNDVVLHVIASFTYIYGDDEEKGNHATRAIKYKQTKCALEIILQRAFGSQETTPRIS